LPFGDAKRRVFLSQGKNYKNYKNYKEASDAKDGPALQKTATAKLWIVENRNKY
jgi:hypothetical protein